MMPYVVARPSPVPRPWPLVVKNGSKMWSRVCASMPRPVSVTEMTAYSPGPISRGRERFPDEYF
jgi:hypothetical protein